MHLLLVVMHLATSSDALGPTRHWDLGPVRDVLDALSVRSTDTGDCM